MSLASLIRSAGLVSVVAAALIVVTEIVGFLLGGEADPVDMINGVVRVFASCLLLLGLISFLLAFLGAMAIAGDLWFEAFAFPYLMEVAPRALEGGRPGGTCIAGAGVSFLTCNTADTQRPPLLLASCASYPLCRLQKKTGQLRSR